MTAVRTICFAIALTGQAAPPVQPRTIDLRFDNGRVWVAARRATVAQILAAWTQAGHTKFEGVEHASNPAPFDVKLTGVPEEEALAVVLRQAGGYTATRRESAGQEESTFARVLIVAAKTLPTPPPPETAAPEPAVPEPPSAPPVIQPAVGPDGTPIPDDQQDAPPFRSMPPGFSPPPETPNQGRTVNKPVTGK